MAGLLLSFMAERVVPILVGGNMTEISVMSHPPGKYRNIEI